MKDAIETLAHTIAIDLFMGYGLYSVVFVILRTFSRKREWLIRFDEAANRVVIFSGLAYAICLLTLQVLPIDTESEQHGWGSWVQPAIWSLITQLLWFRTLRQQRMVRLIFSIFLIGSFETYVIFVTSFHRDYIPSGWSTYTTTYDILLGLAFKTLLFCLLSYLVLYLSDKLKRLST